MAEMLGTLSAFDFIGCMGVYNVVWDSNDQQYYRQERGTPSVQCKARAMQVNNIKNIICGAVQHRIFIIDLLVVKLLRSLLRQAEANVNKTHIDKLQISFKNNALKQLKNYVLVQHSHS